MDLKLDGLIPTGPLKPPATSEGARPAEAAGQKPEAHEADQVGLSREFAPTSQKDAPLPPPPAEAADVPTPIAPNGDLDYYHKRYDDFVKRHPDGPPPPDYYLGYGDVYVRKFTDVTDMHLSPAGMQWLARTRVNLQKAIEKILKDHPGIELQPDKFRELAFKSHIKAYLDAGLAQLPLSDLEKIAVTPSLMDTFNADGISAATAVIEQVIPQKLKELEHHPGQFLGEVKDALAAGNLSTVFHLLGNMMNAEFLEHHVVDLLDGKAELKAAEVIGTIAGHELKQAGGAIVHGVESVGKTVVHGAEDAAKSAVHGVENAAGAIGGLLGL